LLSQFIFQLILTQSAGIERQMLIVPQWRVTETNAPERRNLFSVATGQEAHIATIISGSSSKLSRFDECIHLIETVPDMIATLAKIKCTLDALSFLEDPSLRVARLELKDLVGRLGTLQP
jgi:hypothetical protein